MKEISFCIFPFQIFSHLKCGMNSCSSHTSPYTCHSLAQCWCAFRTCAAPTINCQVSCNVNGDQWSVGNFETLWAGKEQSADFNRLPLISSSCLNNFSWTPIEDDTFAIDKDRHESWTLCEYRSKHLLPVRVQHVDDESCIVEFMSRKWSTGMQKKKINYKTNF